MRKNYIILITLFFSLSIISCNRAEKKYREANSKSTIQEYQSFIQEFPDSKFAILAQNKIDSLAYLKASSDNVEESFFQYSINYPNSKYAKESMDYAETLAFDRVKNQNEEASYLDFIKKYPSSKYVTEIMNNAASMRFEEATNEYSIEEFEKFVNDYPKSNLVELAKINISDIRYGCKYWSEDDFAKKMRNIGENTFSEFLWKKTIIVLKDGGHRMTFNEKRDKRIGTIGLVQWPEEGFDVINLGQFVVFLYQEGIAPNGGIGIGELFFWHRSILVYFVDKSFSQKQMDELLETHTSYVKYHNEINRDFQISIVCATLEH